MAKVTSRPKEQRLIVSDSKTPSVRLKAGQRLDVVTIRLLSPELKKPSKIGARLCGGTNTCLALVDIEPGKK